MMHLWVSGGPSIKWLMGEAPLNRSDLSLGGLRCDIQNLPVRKPPPRAQVSQDTGPSYHHYQDWTSFFHATFPNDPTSLPTSLQTRKCTRPPA